MDCTQTDSKDVKETVASKVYFAELCGLLEKISKTQGNDKKKRILKDFIDHWRSSHKLLHDNDTVCTFLLPIFQKILLFSNVLYRNCSPNSLKSFSGLFHSLIVDEVAISIYICMILADMIFDVILVLSFLAS